MVFLIETKLDARRKETVRRCGFKNVFNVSADGSQGGLCLAWKSNINVTLSSYFSSHIDVFVKTDCVDVTWHSTSFYGSPIAYNRKDSLDLLR